MASFDDCLRNMMDADVISPEVAKELKATFERLREQHSKGKSPEGAAAAAKADLEKRLVADALDKKRTALLSIAAQRRLKDDLDHFRDAKGEQDLGLATLSLLEHYGRAGYSSVAGRAKAILGMAHAEMEQVLHEFGRTWLTGARKNAARMDNVVRELHGEDTGDLAAKALAKAWETVSDGLRQRFNAAGGAIQKLASWGLPQSHNRLALIKRTKELWINDILPLLDPARMVHPLTGDPVPPSELRSLLDRVYDSIVEEGWNTRDPSSIPMGRGAIANQRTDHRFLVFKDADSWLKYQRQYGEPDPFATMMSHIKGMANDIAAMEVLGPNPNATLEWLKQTIMKEAAAAENGKPSRMKAGRYFGVKDVRSTANLTLLELDGIYAELRGGAGPARETAAAWGAGIRNWLVAAKLGSATLSAVTGDPVTMSIAKGFIGLPVANTYQSIARQFSQASRREAVAAGLINEEAMHVLRERARYAGTLAGPEWTRWLPDRVMAWNGLAAWTQAAKHAFGREMQAFLGNRIEGEWDALPEAFRRAAEGYGLDAGAWDVIRKAQAQQIDDARFLRPQDIAAVKHPDAKALSERWLEMILSETEYAVPSGTARGRAAMIGQSRAGTFWGEFRRSAAMFKSFGVSVAMLQGARVAAEIGAGRGARGGAYVGAALTTLTLAGAMSIWLKDIAAGRDPRSAKNTDFWIGAVTQGGGLGIFGDFALADFNRFGNSLPETLAGPVVATVADAYRLTVGQLFKLGRREETNLSEEAVRVLRNYTPGGTLWYVRAAYNRVVLDQLQYLADPKASQKFKRQVRDAQRERNQEFWWAPGEMVPQRAPGW